MVIDQVHVSGTRAREAKDNAPVAGHGDRPITGKIAFQRMQPEARQIHAGGSRHLVETCQDTLHLGNVRWRHPLSIPFLEEKLETLVPEADNHL